jgi:hypothetical protein
LGCQEFMATNLGLEVIEDAVVYQLADDELVAGIDLACRSPLLLDHVIFRCKAKPPEDPLHTLELRTKCHALAVLDVLPKTGDLVVDANLFAVQCESVFTPRTVVEPVSDLAMSSAAWCKITREVAAAAAAAQETLLGAWWQELNVPGAEKKMGWLPMILCAWGKFRRNFLA